MASNDVIVRLRMMGASAFEAQAKGAAQSVGGIGTEAVKTQGKFRSLAGGLGKYAAGFGSILVAKKVLTDSLSGAVDLGEEINKTGVVFRQSGAEVVRWSKDSATALGMSRQQALAAAGTFGNMLVPMGFARKQSANMSKGLVTLAADLASFNNATPEDTLEALRSGLAGETEPLRKFGVFLSDARLKQQALSMGLYKGTGNLTAAGKAAATYALILKDSKDAQGDFARTSGSLANQQRVLRAQYTNLTAQLGTALLPVFQKAVPVLSAFAANMKLVLVGVGALTYAFAFLKVNALLAAAGFTTLNLSILLIPLAIAAIGIALVVAYRKVKWFHDAVDATIGFIKRNWKLLALGLVAPWALAVVLIARKFRTLPGKVSALAGDFVRVGKRLGRAVVDGMVAAIKVAGGAVLTTLRNLPGVGALRKLGGAAAKVLPFQHGGVTRPGTFSLVGERGPELAAFPGGTRIMPVAPAVPSLPGMSARMGLDVPIVLQLDGRTVTQVVAQRTANVMARR